MKAGDIFYSVMQKDNCPFEQPRITKFVVEKIDSSHSYPVVSTKKDKLGRNYVFRKDQIYLNYEDALPEKKKIIEKIEKWEREKREQDRLYFEEQERKEKQRQLEHDNQIRKEVVQELKEKIEKRNNGIRHSNHSEQYKDGYSGCCCDLEEILDQIQGEKK